jgi:levanase/fructan beta-fructosidase
MKMKPVRILAWLALMILVAAGPSGVAQYNPHPEGIDYRERYRPQYHFSPKSEWMNDINGLMYHDGKYHMIYQWGEAKRHGGYATSTNLLHWKDEGVALIPQKSFLPKDAKRNVSGAEVYSGSGVVVSGEVARKITGSDKQAMVVIYTGTEAGTCLAWSNDGGRTWNDYKSNPVANLTKGADPRDPHVFWHEPTQKWIMAIYERGTTFYGSPDLTAWKQLSNINFGFECPDIYELPLDGDPRRMKWVLQDANGTYVVGAFDGTTFTPEQEPLVMDVGPDFYAAQSFFRPNLPTNKVIQIAWNDHWNGGINETPWKRNATFPVEVGLITHNGKMRITRTPVSTIKNLYEGTKKWASETIQCSCQKKNILAGVQSKKFDLTAVFNLNGATAREIEFKIANKAINYSIERQELLGKKLKPDASNVLSIRMLVDWSSLEVFAANGVYSYSEQFAFTPEDTSLQLYANGGELTLISLEFNEIARTWR